MPKIAAIEFCSGLDIKINLNKLEKLIIQSKKNKTDLVVLPEMFAMIGKSTQDQVDISEPLGSGPIQDFLAKISKQNNIWIVAGTIPIKSNNHSKPYAASLVFNNLGECIGQYNKIHLFDVTLNESETYCESDSFIPGKDLTVIDSPIGKLGLAVCYDLRFPYLFTALSELGAEVLAVPAAFTIKTGEAHWEVLLRARAIENFCYVIGAAQGGTHQSGRKTYGHSMIISPWGDILDESKNIVYSEIDLEKLYQIRQSIPVAQHRTKLT